MDIPRKFGIGVTMIIPGFVLGGLVWELLGSLSAVLGWLAVLGVEIVMVIILVRIITGKFLAAGQKA